MHLNIKLYPWFQACRSLLFWQAIWFLYFQQELSASEAILLAAVFDIASAVLEVPSGVLSDRFGRRLTLMLAMLASCAGCLLIANGQSFVAFAAGQTLLGAGVAFASGTDSALLYDSLLETGQESDVATHEVRAWRFTFSALAISASAGGFLYMRDPSDAFVATSLAAVVGMILAYRFQEPARSRKTQSRRHIAGDIATIAGYLRQPALTWLFTLAVAMYVFSHVPFVFGQPFINQAMEQVGFAAETPVVSGAVTTAMMVISVFAGWFTLRVEASIGTTRILLLALSMQIALISILMTSVHPIAITFLLFRMVPDAFAKPFIIAGIQPRIDSAFRATYLSLQSLCGRFGLAATLLVASYFASDDGLLPQSTLQTILLFYVCAGLFVLTFLSLTTRYIRRLSSDA